MRATVIGAGIAGPAAALKLASTGAKVTVQERRAQNDLWSDSTVAITTENIRALAELGVTVPMLPAGSKAVGITVGPKGAGGPQCAPSEWTTKFNIVVWGELHEALIQAGERIGVTYNWRTNSDTPADSDLVVHAQGVRYAAHHSQFTYAYRVYRGTLFADAEPMWVSMHSARQDFVLNIGSTGTQQTWMLYLHEPYDDRSATELVTGDYRAGLMQLVKQHVPEPWASVILRTRTEIQSSPVGDWTMPKMLQWNGADHTAGDHAHHVDIGDAIAPVRPHTTAGANLGIAEALGLTHGYWDEWEALSRINRERELANGHQYGMKVMGR